MPFALRIIDANANRAREALRVMEEAARFILNDAELTGALKKLRHELADLMSTIGGLEAHRDTTADVGTTISTAQEQQRGGLAAVATAAGKRLTEALRAIEEYAKTLPKTASGLPQQIEQLRYRVYSLEQQLNQRLAATTARQWPLCVLVSESLCRYHSWQDVARLAWDAGADCVQLREKQLDDRELLTRAEQLAAVPGRGTLIINDRPDIALLSGADGVHVGQTDLPVAEVRKLVGNQLIVGVSTSCLDQAKQAVEGGADYCALGPMFPTTTVDKPDIAGPGYLKQFLARYPHTAHLAIGGIHADNVSDLVDVGVKGIAVASAVCGAKDPADITAHLLEALSGNVLA